MSLRNYIKVQTTSTKTTFNTSIQSSSKESFRIFYKVQIPLNIKNTLGYT